MKTSSKSKKQRAVSLIIFAISLMVFISCKNNTAIMPQNTISLKYNNQVFNFEDVSLAEGTFSSKKVLTAYGKIEKYEKDNLPYRILLSLKDDGTGKLLFEIVEFGVGKGSYPKNTYTQMYNTAYLDGLNPTNIQTSLTKNNTEIKGGFAGKLRSLNSDVEVSEGKFLLFLDTVKK